MAIFRSIYLAALLGLANLSSAYPSELNGPNYETYTNSLGYEAVRFKPGMEPGSADFVRRFSRNAGLTTSPAEGALAKRQDNRVTFPSVGRNRIPYGCQTDIGNAVLSKLFEVCDDIACDTGSPVTVPVTFPDNGREEDAEVTFVARGTYPSGMKDLLIKAIQAEVIFDAVEIEDVRSDTPGIGAHKYVLKTHARCLLTLYSQSFAVSWDYGYLTIHLLQASFDFHLSCCSREQLPLCRGSR